MAGEALAAVMNKLFQDHRSHRIYAEADDRSVAVRRLLERLAIRDRIGGPELYPLIGSTRLAVADVCG